MSFYCPHGIDYITCERCAHDEVQQRSAQKPSIEPKKMHEKALSTLDSQAPQLLKKLGEVMRENESLKKRIADLENVAYNVPLCGDHAETWFCDRDHITCECFVCGPNPPPKPEIKVEAL